MCNHILGALFFSAIKLSCLIHSSVGTSNENGLGLSISAHFWTILRAAHGRTYLDTYTALCTYPLLVCQIQNLSITMKLLISTTVSIVGAAVTAASNGGNRVGNAADDTELTNNSPKSSLQHPQQLLGEDDPRILHHKSREDNIDVGLLKARKLGGDDEVGCVDIVYLCSVV